MAYPFEGTFVKANRSRFAEWSCRLLITFNIVWSVMQVPRSGSYPDAVYFLTLLALWLYFFKMRLLALVPLVLGLYIHLERMF